MTPAERLGQRLMELRSQSQLTQGIGGKLVEEALSLETRRRRCGELAAAANAVGFAAQMLARSTDERFAVLCSERLAQKIQELERILEECQFVTLACESSTATKSLDAS